MEAFVPTLARYAAPMSGLEPMVTPRPPVMGMTWLNLAFLHWRVPAATLERELHARGFVERPLTAALEPDAVIVWRGADGAAAHACVSLGAELVLNKNAQGWYAPRQILTLETVLESWLEDGLEVCAFAPILR